MSQGVDQTLAHNQAIASIANSVRQESYVMAFNDCFYFIGCTLLLAGFLVVFIKKAKSGGSDLAPIRITLGLAKSSAIKRRVFFLAFLGKIRVLGLVLCVKLTSFFLGARCEVAVLLVINFNS
jgi:hypothetical protein